MRSIRRGILTLAVTATLIGTAGYAAPAQAGGGGDPAVVRIATGLVRGLVAEDRRTFAGIPYAAAPVGDLRWRPPQPAPSWRGVRDATVPGSRCPQPNATGTSEDCLFLNVTTPAASAGARLPVLVWIHGGSLTTGAGSDYGASRLLAGGRVVLVTINYRLGALGFLAHPALDRGRSKSGAYGFADQTAALRWVRRDIAAFGGDPGNVTVSGESAGGGSVCAQLASPAAAGLFRRAIVESAPCVTNPAALPWWRHLTQSENLGVRAAERFGCADPATAAACLREVPIDELLAAAVPASQIAFPPAFGGDVMPEDPGVAVSSGRFNRVPVMHVGTRDEHRLFVAFDELAAGRPVTEAEYQAAVRAQFGADATRLLARYPSAAYGSPSLALAALLTDGAWSCPALRTEQALARYVPTFAAEFADRNAPPFPGTESVSFPQGAFHAAELQYLFDGPAFPDRLNAAQTRLSRQMVRYWLRFAATGNPNSAGSPVWPRFTPRGVHVQSLAPGPHGIRPVDLDAGHQCAFWTAATG